MYSIHQLIDGKLHSITRRKEYRAACDKASELSQSFNHLFLVFGKPFHSDTDGLCSVWKNGQYRITGKYI